MISSRGAMMEAVLMTLLTRRDMPDAADITQGNPQRAAALQLLLASGYVRTVSLFSGTVLVLDAPAVAEAVVYHASRAEYREAASHMHGAITAVLHQLEHGEASQGDRRDIEWCVNILKAATAKAEGQS